MLVCRSAWQRLAPLTQRSSAATLLRNAPLRHMSASSVPGSPGEALPYYLFLGVAIAGGGTYVYRTLSRDRERFRDRHEFIEALKPELDSVKEDSVQVETSEVAATIEEAVEAAIEEAAAEEVIEVVLTTSVEQEQPVAEEEASPPVSEEEPVVNAEVSTEQAEQENTEPVVEAMVVESVPVLEESAPVLEESAADIVEELASAAEDWSELSARKPEESVEENSPATQDSEEAVESEAAASS